MLPKGLRPLDSRQGDNSLDLDLRAFPSGDARWKARRGPKGPARGFAAGGATFLIKSILGRADARRLSTRPNEKFWAKKIFSASPRALPAERPGWAQKKIRNSPGPARSAGQGVCPLRPTHAKISHDLAVKRGQGVCDSLRESRGRSPLGKPPCWVWGGASLFFYFFLFCTFGGLRLHPHEHFFPA
jgi:hypothetical protein